MLSQNLEQSLHRALALANERHHEYATLEHLLLSLTEDQDAIAVLKACGVDVELQGLENVNAQRSQLFVANHQSFFDIFALAGFFAVVFFLAAGFFAFALVGLAFFAGAFFFAAKELLLLSILIQTAEANYIVKWSAIHFFAPSRKAGFCNTLQFPMPVIGSTNQRDSRGRQHGPTDRHQGGRTGCHDRGAGRR